MVTNGIPGGNSDINPHTYVQLIINEEGKKKNAASSPNAVS